jgi:hypothetical protein
MATATREKPLEEASASQLVSRWFTYVLQPKAEEHAKLRAAFERELDREPNHADAWACLSNLYCWEYVHRLNPLEKPMERALEAAWRAYPSIPPVSWDGNSLLKHTSLQETTPRFVTPPSAR